MTLGERIRQVRRQKGLSQAALAGDEITRNMLSLIESGKAQPSVSTLLYLAERLGVRPGTLLEDPSSQDAARSNAETAFRTGEYAACLGAVQKAERPDDGLRWMGAMAALRLARQAIQEARPGKAQEYLSQAQAMGGDCLYWSAEQEAGVLSGVASLLTGQDVTAFVPEDPLLPLLRARAALQRGDLERAAAEKITPPFEAQLHAGQVLLQQGQTRSALAKLQYAEQLLPEKAEAVRRRELYAALEECCQKLEDYQGAYRYASMQLKLTKL